MHAKLGIPALPVPVLHPCASQQHHYTCPLSAISPQVLCVLLLPLCLFLSRLLTFQLLLLSSLCPIPVPALVQP